MPYKNHEAAKAYYRKYYREYTLKHPEKRQRVNRALHNKTYSSSHRELCSRLHRLWRMKNRARFNERSRINCIRHRALKRQAEGSFSLDDWTVIKLLFDNACAYCGRTEPLTVDHKIPLTRGGSNYPDNIQPLCAKCNSIKNARTWFACRPVDKSWPKGKSPMFAGDLQLVFRVG